MLEKYEFSTKSDLHVNNVFPDWTPKSLEASSTEGVLLATKLIFKETTKTTKELTNAWKKIIIVSISTMQCKSRTQTTHNGLKEKNANLRGCRFCRNKSYLGAPCNNDWA